MRRFLTYYLCIALILLPCTSLIAEDTTEVLGRLQNEKEYVAGNYPRSILMKVYLWGAVTNTGVHNIPKNTTLDELISLAGGPATSADIENIRIKRFAGGRHRLLAIDLKKVFFEPTATVPVLEANDIVYIPAKEPLISDSVTRTLSLIASVLGIVVTSILLSDKL